jgi:hypothetical protein
VEYAKESPEDILVQISVHNRGPETPEIHVLPTLWFRNRWSWGRDNPRPTLEAIEKDSVIKATESDLGERYLYCDGKAALLFTENETNNKNCSTARIELLTSRMALSNVSCLGGQRP